MKCEECRFCEHNPNRETPPIIISDELKELKKLAKKKHEYFKELYQDMTIREINDDNVVNEWATWENIIKSIGLEEGEEL